MMPKRKKFNPNYKGKNPPKKAKREKKLPVCPVCGKPIKMLAYEEMNFRFNDAKPHPSHYWVCSDYPNCDTYVGANAQGRPAGLLAGSALRNRRRCIHEWQKLYEEELQTDKKAFRDMCAYRLGITNAETFHTINLNESECMLILDYLKGQYEKDEKLRKIIDEKHFHSTVWKHVHGLDKEKNNGVRYDRDGNVISDSRQPEQQD